jgi:single-strand DNA-binding protein
MFQKYIIAGNLTRDPELRYTTNGTAVCNFGIAANEKRQIQGEYKDVAFFIDVTVWGARAESVSQHMSKGRSVLIEGRLENKQWTKDGETIRKIELVADNVRFIGSKPQSNNDSSDVEPF